MQQSEGGIRKLKLFLAITFCFRKTVELFKLFSQNALKMEGKQFTETRQLPILPLKYHKTIFAKILGPRLKKGKSLKKSFSTIYLVSNIVFAGGL